MNETPQHQRKKVTTATKAEVLKRTRMDYAAHEAMYVYCEYCMAEGELTWTRYPWEKIGTIRLEEGFVWEHVIPVFHGGSSDPDNIVIACTSCNNKKGTKLDFIGEIEQWRLDNPIESSH